MGVFDAIGSVVGGLINAQSAKNINKKQLAYADALNKNRIQWTVEDAKKAGIHPLAALGASSVGGFASPSFVAPQWGDAVASGFSALEDAFDGSRGSREASGPPKKLGPTQGEVLAESLGLERAQLQNELLRTEIASMRSRTAISNMRAAATGGPVIRSPFGAIDVDTKVDPADTYEQRYGEISDWIFGPAVLASDLAKTHRKDREAFRRKYPPGAPPKFGPLWSVK